MTSDKCEHLNVDWTQNAERQQGGPDWKPVYTCRDCGLRFVPEDLLREARGLLQAEEDLHDGAPHPTRGDLLRRIDAALGKEGLGKEGLGDK